MATGLAVKVELRDFNLTGEPDDRLPLAELLTKVGDGDFLRSVAEAVVQMEGSKNPLFPANLKS